MFDNAPFQLINTPRKPAGPKPISENVRTTQPILFLGSHTDDPRQQDLFNPNDYIAAVVPQPTNCQPQPQTETTTMTATQPTHEETAAQLESDLAHFFGGDDQYAHWSRRLIYTAGVQFLAERADCYWLIDAIASYLSGRTRQQIETATDGLQIWRLRVDHSGTPKCTKRSPMAVLTCSRDLMENGETVAECVRQAIPFTDFPLDEIVLYCCANASGIPYTLMLRSEN